MKLNCKANDLAVRIRAHSGCHIPAGAIVECIEMLKGGVFFTLAGVRETKSDVWRVKFRGKETGDSGLPWGIEDSELRPIRPEKGDDETLAWAGKPEKVTA